MKYVYECDMCGACCIHLGIPVTEDDIRQEPRIALHVIEYPDDRKFLGHPSDRGCPLLTDAGLCGVQATKPRCCANFPAGGVYCQNARGKAGLNILRPIWIGDVNSEE